MVSRYIRYNYYEEANLYEYFCQIGGFEVLEDLKEKSKGDIQNELLIFFDHYDKMVAEKNADYLFSPEY